MLSYAIPLGALVISVAALVGSQLMSLRTIQQSASNAMTAEQSKRLDALQREVVTCQEDRADLQKQVNALKDREYELMQRLLRLETIT